MIKLFIKHIYEPLFGGFRNNVYILIYELKKELVNIRLEIEQNKDENALLKLKEREQQIILSLNEFYS
jgi:hypothetical protein